MLPKDAAACGSCLQCWLQGAQGRTKTPPAAVSSSRHQLLRAAPTPACSLEGRAGAQAPAAHAPQPPSTARHPHPGSTAVCRRGEISAPAWALPHPCCSKPQILREATRLQMHLQLHGTDICPSSSSLLAEGSFTRSVARICDSNDFKHRGGFLTADLEERLQSLQ